MARAYCTSCLRPKVTCICQFMVAIANKIPLIILQHPSEVKNYKATVPMLCGSLDNVHAFVGEDFSKNEELQTLMTMYSNPALLYPSDSDCKVFKHIGDSQTMHELDNLPDCLIVLDGTWRKAYKMYQMNYLLHGMQHVALSEQFPCAYQIRKTRKVGALSTLEASCYMLAILEQNSERYQPLLNSFVEFNRYQQNFVKSEPSQENG